MILQCGHRVFIGRLILSLLLACAFAPASAETKPAPAEAAGNASGAVLAGEQLSAHWTVSVDADGRPARWTRVASAPTEQPIVLSMPIDRSGPQNRTR